MRQLLFILPFLLLFSCKKAEDRSCYKASGEKNTVDVPLPDFDKLVLHKKLRYVLVQDDTNFLRISGGKNLLNFIRWEETEDGKISVFNENKCDFLRDLKSICTVEIHFKTLNDIRYEGSDRLTNADTLHLNLFNLLIVDCSGSVELTVKANYLTADIAESYGDYTCHGSAENTVFSARNNGYCDVRDFKTNNKLHVTNKSTGDMYINASGCLLEGFIGGSGNIYYTGEALSVQMEYFSSGKLIPY